MVELVLRVLAVVLFLLILYAGAYVYSQGGPWQLYKPRRPRRRR